MTNNEISISLMCRLCADVITVVVIIFVTHLL